MALTQVSSGGIKDGSITNADLDSSAAIDGSKVSPDFGDQDITTTGTVTGAALIPGGSAVPTDGIYLADTNKVALSTNGAQRLVIDASGKVGIGATPTQVLDIATTGSNCYITLERTDAGTPGALLIGSANVTNQIQSGGDKDFNIFTNGTEKLRITSAGLVGIGTSAPGAALDVRARDLHLGATSGDAGLITFRRDSGAQSGYFGWDAGSDTVMRWGNDSGSGRLAFNTNSAERVRIDENGRVGIGTTSPTNPLTIQHTSGYGITLTNTDTTSTAINGIRFNVSNFTFGGAIYVDSAVTGGSPYDLHIRSGQTLSSICFNNVSGTERARIDSSGRLLVGTSSSTSSSKLVVSGHIDCANLNPSGTVARNKSNFNTSTTVDLPRGSTFLITVRCQSGAFGTAPRSGLFMFTANAGTTSGIQAPVAVGGDTGAFSLSVANISTAEVQLTIAITDTGRIFGSYGIIRVT